MGCPAFIKFIIKKNLVSFNFLMKVIVCEIVFKYMCKLYYYITFDATKNNVVRNLDIKKAYAQKRKVHTPIYKIL